MTFSVMGEMALWNPERRITSAKRAAISPEAAAVVCPLSSERMVLVSRTTSLMISSSMRLVLLATTLVIQPVIRSAQLLIPACNC